jgi:hypothetical protein
MTTAIAAFLTFYSGNTTHGRWQNFFVNKTVNSHNYVNFDTSEILLNRSADEGGISITMAAKDSHLTFFETAIANEYLGQITLYEMPVSSSLPTDLSNATVIARFVGEVMGMSTDLTQIKVELGAALDAVSGDIPGRKMTTSLVGRLPSL